MNDYALAQVDHSTGAGVVGVRRTTGNDGFVPTVTWIGRIADGRGGHRDLRMPLRIDVSQDPDDGNFIAFCPYANCGGVGPNPEEATFDLGLEILRVRDDLASTPDDRLANDAIDLKQRLLLALP